MKKIAFAGTANNAARTLEALFTAGHEISVVITKPDAPVGRKKIVTESAVARMAEKLALPLIKSASITTEVEQQLAQMRVDLGLVVAYGSILSSSALRSCADGWFNLHYSLLPAYRGAAPVQHALIKGENETGVTLFRLDEDIDTGSTIGQVSTQISPDENARELLERLTELGISLLLQELPKILSDNYELISQSGVPSAAPKLHKSDCQIDWNLTAQKVHNLVRGANPEPGAWTLANGAVMKIHRTSLVSGPTLQPGSLLLQNSRLLVGCGDATCLVLEDIQPSGKTAMSALDWYRGNSLAGLGQ